MLNQYNLLHNKQILIKVINNQHKWLKIHHLHKLFYKQNKIRILVKRERV